MGTEAFDAGLAGVVVAETRLSEVEGEVGRLIIAGDDAEALAGVIPFEEVLRRLLAAAGAAPPSAAEIGAGLGRARVAAFAARGFLEAGSRAASGAAAVRASVATLEAEDGGSDPVGDAIRIAAAVGVAAAAFARRRGGGSPVAPDPSASHAADVLRAARGSSPSPEEAAGLDGYLVTVSDHGMNASTFTARVVASTGTDLVSAVVAAVGALKGPLHGGAPGPVLDMLEAVGTPDRARAWLEAELGAGRRIMGMGHRIYRARDPRAAILERLARSLRSAEVDERIAIARAVEREAEALLAARKPDRPLKANVEFFTAVLLDALGLHRDAFTAMFAAGRVAGWCAHVIEQRATGRLVRPASRYLGPMPATPSA
jgi:citrate synthase